MYSRCYAIGEYGTTVYEQRLGKYDPAETNTHVTLDLLLETGRFLCCKCRGVMNRTV
jgi:hypothetical protein